MKFVFIGIKSLKIIKDVERHGKEEEELLPCIPQIQQGIIKSCVFWLTTFNHIYITLYYILGYEIFFSRLPM